MDRVLKVLGKDTVWLILDELSKKNQTPTDLAKTFDMSIANVNNFLERLEDKGLVKRVKKIRKGRGRPFTEYSLNPKAPIFIFMPGEGKRYHLESLDQVMTELKRIIEEHKGGSV